jgi:hypothetical protein
MFRDYDAGARLLRAALVEPDVFGFMGVAGWFFSF